MGVPRRPEWPRLANFGSKLGLWEARFGVGDPRSRVWEAQIRDQGPQIWPKWPNLGSPRQISPLGDRILTSFGGQNPVDLA